MRGSLVRCLSAILLLVTALPLAVAAEDEPAPEPEKVEPAKYRILVDLDDETVEGIRKEIEAEVRKALEARQRRLRLSKEEFDAQLQKELDRYKEDLEAIRHAQESERRALELGDDAEALRRADIWRERTRDAIDLARRLRELEAAFLDLSLQNWREQRRRERLIAEKALEKLDGLLEQIDAAREAEIRERGGGIAPPHE